MKKIAYGVFASVSAFLMLLVLPRFPREEPKTEVRVEKAPQERRSQAIDIASRDLILFQCSGF